MATSRSRNTASSVRERVAAEQNRLETEKEQRKQRAGEPHRFFVKSGETREIVIVDSEITFARREHVLMDSGGKYRNVVPCICEHADCPVCEEFPQRQSTLNLLLTCIDLTPYETTKGEKVEWSKKLLVVKPGQHKKFLRWEEKKYEGETGLRGLILVCTRDGDKDFSIGNDIEIDGRMSEDELLDFESSYKNSEDKTVEVLGHEPFDYEEIFPQLSAEEICALANIKMTTRAGSRSADDRAIGRTRRGGDDAGEDDAGSSRRSAGRARGRSSADTDEDAAPATRRSARRASDDTGDEDTSAAPATRRGARGQESTEAPAGRRSARRGEREDPEETEAPARTARRRGATEEEDPPQRGARRTVRTSGRIPADNPLHDPDDGEDPTNDVEGARGDSAPAERSGARRAVRRR